MKSFTQQTLKIYWQHAKKYKWHVFGICFFLILSVSGETAGPYLYKQFINILASSDFTKYDRLIFILVLIITARTIRSASFRVKDLLNDFFEPRVMSDLNNTCFKSMHQHSYNFFSGNFVGSLVNKVKKMERGFEIVADRIVDDFLRTFLAIAFAVTVLSFRSWLLGLAVSVWCVIYLAAIYTFSTRKIMKFNEKKSELDTKIIGQLADTITNNVNIKLFSNFAVEQKNFQKITDDHFKVRRHAWDLMTYLEMMQAALMLILEAIMMYLGLKFWRAGILTVGDFTLIQLYLISIFDKLWSMGKQVRNFYEALADANEMTEILIEPYEVQDVPNAKTLKPGKGEIEFKNVGFSYYATSPPLPLGEGRGEGKARRNSGQVFQNFNLLIKSGERVALIGPSGGGKSTITKLLLRFHDIQTGEIIINGQNISQITQNSLRDQMAMVPQDPILFHRTLMENIRYGKFNATDAEVIAAAKAAHAHEFIMASQHGYKTFVGERGIKLSGGQRQRVAIARAILKNAPILILDEATSSLDSESEQYIQEALKNLMENKTVIVIAHRLSTIMQMDRIIVLDGGKITEEGTHKELVKAKEGTYQRLWQIQAGGFSSV